MKKAVVTEVNKGSSTVLTDDWGFINVKGEYEIGSEIVVTDEMIRRSGRAVSFAPKRIAAAAAAVLVVATLGAGTYSTTAVAATTVSIESGDTEITLDVNYLGYVIDVTASGTDGNTDEFTQEIKREDIRFKKCPDAIDNITRRMKDRGLVDKNSKPEIGIKKAPGDKAGEKLKTEIEKRGYEVEKKYKPDEKPSSQPGGEKLPEEKPESKE